MKKVLISRPRVGGVNQTKRKKVNMHQIDEFGDFDDGLPTKTSTKKDTVGLNGEEKSQTDLMGPLRRYLRKQVGRPWNDVWSEICSNNKDYMGEHLKTHVEWEVVTNCWFDENNKLTGEYGWLFYRSTLYVHPVTGILSLSKGTSSGYKRKKPEIRIVEMDGMEYYLYEDIWYRIKTIPYVKPTQHHMWYVDSDVFGSVKTNDGFFGRYGKAVRCVWKQQANSKEVKKLNQSLQSKQAA